MVSFYTIIEFMIKKHFKAKTENMVRYSQSNIHDIIKNYLPKPSRVRPVSTTQSIKHEQKQHVKVIIAENKAYWIMQNNFYTANVYDGNIDRGSAEVVDTFSLDKEELDKMLFIMDQLKNGN